MFNKNKLNDHTMTKCTPKKVNSVKCYKRLKINIQLKAFFTSFLSQEFHQFRTKLTCYVTPYTFYLLTSFLTHKSVYGVLINSDKANKISSGFLKEFESDLNV